MEPCIILQVSPSKQAELIQKIQFINGVYTSEVSDATHLVCEELTCSELFLEACAKGLWILSVKFVEDSFDLGFWLKEENYEHSSDGSESTELMLAAKRWRWKISLFQEKPFSGWNVAVDLKLSNNAFLKRILKHGGANVVVFKSSPRPQELPNITYVFLDSTNASVADDLITYGFLCLDPKYITDTIIKDAVLDPFDYIIRNTFKGESQRVDNWSNVNALGDSSSIVLPEAQAARKSVQIKTIPRSKQTDIQEIVCADLYKPLISTIKNKQTKRDQKSNQGAKSTFCEEDNQVKLNGALVEVSNIISQQLIPSSQGRKDRNIFDSLRPSFYLHGPSPSKSVLSTKCSSPSRQKSLLDLGFEVSRSVSANKSTNLDSTFPDAHTTKTQSATSASVVNADENVIVISDDEAPVETVSTVNQKKVTSTSNTSLLNYFVKTELDSEDTSPAPSAPFSLNSSPVRTKLTKTPTRTKFTSTPTRKKLSSRPTRTKLSSTPSWTKLTGTPTSTKFAGTPKRVKLTITPTRTKSVPKKKKRIQHTNTAMLISKPSFSPFKQQNVKTNPVVQSLTYANESTCSFEKHLTWPLSFPVGLTASSSDLHKCVHSLYGEWMSSARELDFPDVALTYATPSLDHVPQLLLVNEIICLLLSSDLAVTCKANAYLHAWLHMHPPTNTRMIRLYKNAFHFYPSDLHFFDRIDSLLDSRNYVTVSRILEFSVSLFEFNWIHCLQRGTKEAVQTSMMVSWLWKSPYVVQHGASTNQLLKLLETSVSIPDFKFSISSAIVSLIAIASKSIRLANVKWALDNHFFVVDPVISLANDLTKKLIICSEKTDFETMIALVQRVEPGWFRSLVVAKLLSDCYTHLLIGKFQVKHLSWATIVHHFLYLVPTLKDTHKPAADEQANTLDRSSNALHGGPHTHVSAKKANKTNAKGESAVHIACRKNDVGKLQELLLIPGVNVNLKDYAGWTPLHEACNHGSLECVRLLLKYTPLSQDSSKIEVNPSGPDGVTPLMDAVKNNHIEVSRELLRFGGKVIVLTKTDQGYTALDFACTEDMKATLTSTPELNAAVDDTPSNDREAVFIPYKDCREYLALLTLLLTSYHSHQLSLRQCCPSSVIDAAKDSGELQTFETHLEMFTKCLAKLTTPEDYIRLKSSLLCLELVFDSLRE